MTDEPTVVCDCGSDEVLITPTDDDGTWYYSCAECGRTWKGDQ